MFFAAALPVMASLANAIRLDLTLHEPALRDLMAEQATRGL